MILFKKENKDDQGRLILCQGDHGIIPINLVKGVDFEEGDQLIFRVRRFPNDASPLVFESINETTNVRINCEDTENQEPGEYSAQLFIYHEGDHCPIEIWPEPNGKPDKTRNLKNFIIHPRVKGGEMNG